VTICLISVKSRVLQTQIARSSHGEKSSREKSREKSRKEIHEYRSAEANEEIILMKLSEYKSDFYEFSGKASDVARAAAFAGIALVWVFKIDAKPVPRLPDNLLIPIGLFALGLAFDLLHYITASVIWGAFHWLQERKLSNPTDDPDLSHPDWLSWPVYLFFGLKLICVITGYFLILCFVVTAWRGQNP